MKTFSKNDQNFICVNCKKEVSKLGYSSRNHCPFCLYSLHVDVNPGDRASSCKGFLEPVFIQQNSQKGYIINFKCKKCGKVVKNKAAADDSLKAIMEVSKKV